MVTKNHLLLLKTLFERGCWENRSGLERSITYDISAAFRSVA